HAARGFCHDPFLLRFDRDSAEGRLDRARAVPQHRRQALPPAELSLIYRTKGKDATKVTFAWADDVGPHREAHVFDSGGAAEWQLQTGRNVLTRWVEFEPVARK